LAIWAADVCSRAARQLICIEPTGLRLRHIGKKNPLGPPHALAQLVLALGPSPRPCLEVLNTCVGNSLLSLVELEVCQFVRNVMMLQCTACMACRCRCGLRGFACARRFT